MDTQTLKRLNGRLADLRGRNPHSQPIYKWFHSHDLTYPARTATGYEHWRQVDEDRWLVAMWMPPMSRAAWRDQFPDLGYPAQGMYYATDVMLSPGIEPNDTITDQVAGFLKNHEGKTIRDHMNDIEYEQQRREAAKKAKVSDIIDDTWTAFNNVPGSRNGSVSFGGFEETKQ